MHNIRVMVYGTLLAGYGNHRAYMQTAKLVGEATMRGKMYSLGAFPCVSLHGDNTIRGEVYDVDEETLKYLDRLEGHPRFYCREVVETTLGPAWVYLINRDDEMSSTPVVASGSWREYTKRNGDRNAA